MEITHKKKHLKKFHPEIFRTQQENSEYLNKSEQEERYSFNCVQCGNCCRQGWNIPVLKEDLQLILLTLLYSLINSLSIIKTSFKP